MCDLAVIAAQAEWIHDVREKFKEGDEVRVRILSVEPQPGGGQPRVALAATEEGTPEPRPPPREEQPLPGVSPPMLHRPLDCPASLGRGLAARRRHIAGMRSILA